MKISSFTVKNFKGIGADGITINFAPVTLLFGANNSGKSSAIQALFLAREVICNGNINPDTVQGGGRAIKLGGFQNFVHNHNLEKSVILRFDITTTDEIRPVIHNDYESVMINNNAKECYTWQFFSNNFSNIRNIAYEVSLSWDKNVEGSYISNRKLYVNNILFLSVDTKISQNVAKINFINNIFTATYDGGTISNKDSEIILNNQYDFIQKYSFESDENDKEKEYTRFKKIINTIINEHLDYNIYNALNEFVTNSASIEAYKIVERMIILSLFGNNKLNFDRFIEDCESMSMGCKEILSVNFYNDWNDCDENIIESRIIGKYNDKYIDRKTLSKKYINERNLYLNEKYHCKFLSCIKSKNSKLTEDCYYIDFEEQKIKGNEHFLENYFPRKFFDENLSELFFSVAKYLKQKLNQLLYIGTQRVTIERHFNPETIQALTWANGMAAWQELMNSHTLVDKVNNEIPKVLGADFNVRLVHLKDVSIDIAQLAARLNTLKLHSKTIMPEQLSHLLAEIGADMHNRVFFVNQSGAFLSPNDLGHGISQIIPILVAPLLQDNNANIVIIEEPESNIHPAWQVELAEFFLRVACKKNGATSKSGLNDSDNQSDETQMKNESPILLLETHSEHIMLRILRRIRETHESELPEGAQPTYPQDVAVHYTQRDNEGNTQVKLMEITPDGDFSNRWPKGFFEERAEELF